MKMILQALIALGLNCVIVDAYSEPRVKPFNAPIDVSRIKVEILPRQTEPECNRGNDGHLKCRNFKTLLKKNNTPESEYIDSSGGGENGNNSGSNAVRIESGG